MKLDLIKNEYDGKPLYSVWAGSKHIITTFNLEDAEKTYRETKANPPEPAEPLSYEIILSEEI